MADIKLFNIKGLVKEYQVAQSLLKRNCKPLSKII